MPFETIQVAIMRKNDNSILKWLEQQVRIIDTMKTRKISLLVAILTAGVTVVVAYSPVPYYPQLEVCTQTNAIHTGNQSVCVGGYNNTYFSTYSMLIGKSNLATRHPNSLPPAGNGVGYYALVSGYGNQVVGNYSAAIGRGLIAESDYATGSKSSVVVGQYNRTADYTGDVAFAVGTGDNAANDENGLIVYHDGAVVVPQKQGDIGMGQFGTP